MDIQKEEYLHRRNRGITEAVLARAERLCPDALELIAVTGSFAYGDFREDSDLDLLIVLRDGAEDRLSHCFLMDDSAHDLYTRRWSDLEHTASFADPFGGKLLDGQICWVRDDAAAARFYELRRRLTERLDAPLCAEDRLNACQLLSHAAGAYGRMCLSAAYSECRMWSGIFWQLLAEGLYLLNHACVRSGVKGMLGEMASFSLLPEQFSALTERLIQGGSREELCRTCAALWHITETCIHSAPCTPLVAGTYEEAFSNWKGKIRYAAKENDAFLAFVSTASCGYFYEEMAQTFGMPKLVPFPEESCPTPSQIERSFNDALEAYGKYCSPVQKPVRYENTEDLMRRYGCGENNTSTL